MVSVVVGLLGQFHLFADGRLIRFPTRKAEVLFAYLVLNGRKVVERDRIAGILWPDVDDARARRNLSTALWRVKRAVQSVAAIELVANDNSIALHCRDTEIDVDHFTSLLESVSLLRGEERREVLSKAEELYRGDLLEGYDDEWCDEIRRQLRVQYMRLLKHLVQASKDAGDYDAGIACSRKIMAADPLDEDSHRELMLLYHLRGDRAAALAQYDALKRVLWTELSIRPAQATTELWEYIRSRTESALSYRAHALGTDDRFAMCHQFAQMPIVGREQYVTTLVQGLEQAARCEGSGVVVSGEAGIGKTRLVEVVAIEAGLRGFEVLQGRCPDLQAPLPYQVFVQALWPRISAVGHLDGVFGTSLTSFVRELAADMLSQQRSRDFQAGFFDSAIVTETLLSFLGGSYSTRPTLLILEDIQGLDKASATLLVTLMGRLAKSRLFVLSTVRSHETAADQIISTLAANGATKICLGPLTEQETGRLAQAALRSKHVSSSAVRYVWEHTGGIPLFIVEFLKFLTVKELIIKDQFDHWSLSEGISQLKTTDVPSRVHEAIQKRIEILDRASRALLCSAAVLGMEMEFDQLREFSGFPETDFVECTDRLLNGQLLQETERGFRFRHESIRTVTLSMLNKTRLRMLHMKAGNLFERLAPGRTEDLSWHFLQAGKLEKALSYAEASGDKARAVYANSDAATWYTRALQLLGTLGEEGLSLLRRHVDLLLKRQEVLDLLGARQSQLSDIDMVCSIAQRLHDRSILAQALYLRAGLLIRMNASEEALRCARRAVRLFRAVGDVRGEAGSYEAVGMLFLYLRRHDLAQPELQRAVSLLRQVRDGPREALARVHLAAALAWSNTTAAAKCLSCAEALLRDSNDRRSLAIVSLQRGVLSRYLGRLGTSESLLLAGIDAMRQIGDRVGEARGLSQLACTHAAMGKLRDALHEGRRAVRVAREAKDERAQIVGMNNLAYMPYRFLGDFQRAERCTAEAMKTIAEAGGSENTAMYADTMAASFLDRAALDAALHWAKQSEALYACSGSKLSLGAEIQLHLGQIYLELGQHARAFRYLRQARMRLAKTHDVSLRIHAVAALARLYLARGRLSSALKYAREVSHLLRRVDGVEQIQKIYWSQYHVLRSTGAKRATRRVLGQAYKTVIQQASTLKGRMRRRFLTEVRVNREILEEFTGTQQSFRHRGSEGASLNEGTEVMKHAGIAAGNGQAALIASRENEANGRKRRIDDRRRAVLSLLQRQRVTQQVLARMLGVSVRTVRYDVAVLRTQGLLSSAT